MKDEEKAVKAGEEETNAPAVGLDPMEAVGPVELNSMEKQFVLDHADEIINTLETERESVLTLIQKAHDVILKKGDEIERLKERRENIDQAITELKKVAPKKEPEAGPLFEGTKPAVDVGLPYTDEETPERNSPGMATFDPDKPVVE